MRSEAVATYGQFLQMGNQTTKSCSTKSTTIPTSSAQNANGCLRQLDGLLRLGPGSSKYIMNALGIDAHASIEQSNTFLPPEQPIKTTYPELTDLLQLRCDCVQNHAFHALSPNRPNWAFQTRYACFAFIWCPFRGSTTGRRGMRHRQGARGA